MTTKRALAVLLFVAVAAGGTAGAVVSTEPTTAQVGQPETIDGLSVTVPGSEQAQIREQVEQANQFGFDLKPNIFRVYADGETYIVLTDEQPQTGSATVEGQVYDLGVGTPIVIADSVSVDTQGERVAFEDLQENPRDYVNQHVRVDAHLQQLSFAGETAGARGRFAFGALRDREGPVLSTAIGSQSRFSTVQLSSGELGDGSTLEQINQVFGNSSGVGVRNPTTDAFWTDGRVTIDLVVRDTYPPQMHVANIQLQSQARLSPSELANSGDEYAGEVVTIEADVVGSATSTKDYLTSVAPCGDDGVVVGVTPPGCVPVVTDATMHSGVLFDGVPESRTEVIPYAGVSNIDTRAATVAEEGHYEVTGRVVATSQISSSLPNGYGLVVYDRERTGAMQTPSDAVDQATAFSEDLTADLQAQLETTENDGALASAVQRDGSDNGETGGKSEGEAALAVVDSGFVEQQVRPGESVVVEATVRNRGNAAGEMDVNVSYPGGQTVETKPVTVSAGSSKTVEFRHSRPGEGSIRLYVNGQDIGLAKYVAESGSDGGDGTSGGDSSSSGQSGDGSSSDALAGGEKESLIKNPPAPAVLYGGGLGGMLIGGLLTIVGGIVSVVSWRSDEAYNERLINWTFGVGYVTLSGGLTIAGWARGAPALAGTGILLALSGLVTVWVYLVGVYSRYAIGVVKDHGTGVLNVFKK